MGRSNSAYPVENGSPNYVVGMVPMNVDADGIARPAGAPVFNSIGNSIAYTASAVAGTIPSTSTGAHPLACRFASTTACYVKLTSPDDVAGVVASAGADYLPGDEITLDGGTFESPAVLAVDTVQLITVDVDAPGTGISAGDTIDTVEGDMPAVVTVTHTQVVSAAVDDGGADGTPGTATVTGTTGTGTKFQATVTIGAGGDIESVDAIAVAGNYTVDPTDIAAEPVTGGGLTGATLSLVLGALTVVVSTPGAFSDAPFSLTGDSVDVTFTNASYGVLTASTVSGGDYTTVPANPVAQDTTTGAGSGATFTMTWATPAQAGDLLVQPGDAVVISTENFDQVSAIRVAANGILVISPLEN